MHGLLNYLITQCRTVLEKIPCIITPESYKVLRGYVFLKLCYSILNFWFIGTYKFCRKDYFYVQSVKTRK